MKPIKLEHPNMHLDGMVGSFHPDGHDFSNAAELQHWILTGEKKTVHNKSVTVKKFIPEQNRF